jgi:hypothetical protein
MYLRINNVVIPSADYEMDFVRERLSLDKKYYLKMDYKVQLNTPLIEAQYNTVAETCPKCLAVKTIDDLVVNTSGDFTVTDKEYLLLQNVEKSIVTRTSSNPFHYWYGTGLHDLIGTKIIDISFLRTKIIDQIVAALDKLQNIQKQMMASRRKIDPGELFGKLLKIDVKQADDPTFVLVVVTFTSQASKQLEYSQYMQLNGDTRERVAFQ